MYKTARGGIKSQRSGAALENVMNIICKYLKSEKIAEIYKIPTQMRYVNNQYRFTQKSTVDYVGYRFTDGKIIAIEVKNAKNNIRFYSDQKRLHQLQYLARVHIAGGIALFVIRSNMKYYIFKPFWDELVNEPQKFNFAAANYISDESEIVDDFLKLIRNGW